jgi:hypothetical protein
LCVLDFLPHSSDRMASVSLSLFMHAPCRAFASPSHYVSVCVFLPPVAPSVPQWVITGLRQGVPHYVTVAAHNGISWGPATASEPASETPVNQPPSQPPNVAIETLSNGDVLVQWAPSVNDGGDAVFNYEVEWDTVSTFSSASRIARTVSVPVSSLSPVSDVQSISTYFNTEAGRAG